MSDLRNGHASKPYCNTGMHLIGPYDLNNNLLRCSPSNLTKYGIRGFKKDRLSTYCGTICLGLLTLYGQGLSAKAKA